MKRSLQGSVVVITGASSGIGRGAARAFAAAGASVVLAARRQHALEAAAMECRDLGGGAVAVATDISELAAVERLAQQAIATFGRIDVWVNNATVTIAARFEEASYEAYRRVLDVNLRGYIHGARAVLPHFRAQGHGVLINNASVGARVGQPYTSADAISRHGIRALSECLRQELQGTGIHVCTVTPAWIDTLLLQDAASHTVRVVEPVPPAPSAESVVATLVGLAQRPRREVLVGAPGRASALQRTPAPTLSEQVVERDHALEAPAEPGGQQLVERAPARADVNGEKTDRRRMSSLMRAALGIAGAGAVIALVCLVIWSTRHGDAAMQQEP